MMIRYAPLPVRINPNVVITYYNVATTRFTRHNWNIPTVHLREFILSDRKQISSAGEKYRDLFTWRSTKESYFHDHCVMGNEYYKVWEDFINQLYVPRCEVLVLNFIQPLAQANHLVNLPDWNEVNFCQFYPESTKSVAEIRKPLSLIFFRSNSNHWSVLLKEELETQREREIKRSCCPQAKSPTMHKKY